MRKTFRSKQVGDVCLSVGLLVASFALAVCAILAAVEILSRHL